MPEAEAVPRFFDESTHHAMQQDFLSPWDRRGDNHVRTVGRVVESPIRAVTELMVALRHGSLSKQRRERPASAWWPMR